MSSNKDYKWSKNWARAAGGVKRGRKGNRGRRREGEGGIRGGRSKEA